MKSAVLKRKQEIEIKAALEVLAAAGVRLAVPAAVACEVLRVADVAELLQEHEQKVREYCRRGLFAGCYQTEGGELRIPIAAVQEYQRLKAEQFSRAFSLPRLEVAA